VFSRTQTNTSEPNFHHHRTNPKSQSSGPAFILPSPDQPQQAPLLRTSTAPNQPSTSWLRTNQRHLLLRTNQEFHLRTSHSSSISGPATQDPSPDQPLSSNYRTKSLVRSFTTPSQHPFRTNVSFSGPKVWSGTPVPCKVNVSFSGPKVWSGLQFWLAPPSPDEPSVWFVHLCLASSTIPLLLPNQKPGSVGNLARSEFRP